MIAVMDTETQSPYERIGGEEGVANLVDTFYGRVLADPELKGFFERTSIEKLTAMQREFFAVALGGPTKYTGQPLSSAHFGRGIGKQHLSRFLDHLLATLRTQDLDEQTVLEIIRRVMSNADAITGTGPDSE